MDVTRRDLLRLMALGAASLAVPKWPRFAWAEEKALITKAIPSTGEKIPAIGMGTWLTFNVGNDARLIETRAQVLREFFARGGGMVDSSPMYTSSEEVIGRCLKTTGVPKSLFSASKIWTASKAEGPAQFEDSKRLWGLPTFDLFQVHNLRNWEDHLKTLRRLKEEGAVRYVGVTTSHGRRHEELEAVMKSQPLDFIQLTYNIEHREAEDRLLGLARDRGLAVIANRPYDGGDLIRRLKTKPLPPWAADIDCATWPQFLLKFVVSHPAVTCAIPATSRVDHMGENMGACWGRLPGEVERGRMVQYIENL